MASEFYHYRARAYDPGARRFFQKDPAGMVDGTNLYAYVGNSPINFVDPSGLAMKGKTGGGGGGDGAFTIAVWEPPGLDCGTWYEWLFNPIGVCAWLIYQLYQAGGSIRDQLLAILAIGGSVMGVNLYGCVAQKDLRSCGKLALAGFATCTQVYSLCERYDVDPLPPPEGPHGIPGVPR